MSANLKRPPEYEPIVAMARKAGIDQFYAEEFAKVIRVLLDVPMGSPEHRNAVITSHALLTTFDEARADAGVEAA